MASTPTSPDTPTNASADKADDSETLSDKAREKAASAKKKASKAAKDTSAAAKKRPYAAVALATGTLAAIGGAAFGIFKVTGKKDGKNSKPKVKPSAD
ncbi:hypothetical protein KY084_01005 [Stakelama sp. CBK3Z-3]|uniref:Uncharacterized protein n=1 Tax=Stakelama flava TaxID=2860338 RepID=A0ABS6XGX0_9SPHN|nr:hypothetical protein [Stakelama flava]MBW4329456.1 hypothetical protein [Stakelama flava]